MTDEELSEYDLLKTMSPRGTFAIAISATLAVAQQHALERLQVREWVRLVDVSLLDAESGVFRVFLVTEPAKEWMRKQG